MIETKKPSMVVHIVDMVCSSITGHTAAVTLKIWLGAGSRYSGIETTAGRLDPMQFVDESLLPPKK
jgi:hypothetical protein